MIRRIAIRAVILHEGKLLCVRLVPNPTMPDKGTFWCLPGGGLEEGEDLLGCLQREMVEETGVEPVAVNLLYIQQFKDNGAEHLEFIFAVTNASDYLHIDLGKTTHGTLELAELEFIDPKTSNVLPKFLQATDIAADIRSGQTKYYNNF